jgi:large subunit ribosomal protein L9
LARDGAIAEEGYTRNFLLPRGKALRATADNKSRFEGMKGELQAKSLEAKGVAGETAAKVDGKSYTVIRQASESGQLFGSVSPRDIASLVKADGAEVTRSHVVLNAPIKSIGQYKVPLALHPDVEVSITITVARGENVTVRREDAEEEAAAALANAEAFFEPEAAKALREGEEGAEAGGEAVATADADKPAKPAKKAKKKDEEA